MRPIDTIVAVLCALSLALQLANAAPRLRQPVQCRPMPAQSGRLVF